jgi:hypothetical protein
MDQNAASRTGRPTRSTELDGSGSERPNFAPTGFAWTTCDVTTLLPVGWEASLADVVQRYRSTRIISPPHSSSREQGGAQALCTVAVHGALVSEALPWLVELYRGPFREVGEVHARRQLLTARNPRYAVVVNVQEPGGDRSECHVDTNPIAGLLYATEHRPGTGGELAVANDSRARNVKDVDRDCSVVYPQKGHLVFFDGRSHPHYVRPVTGGEIRVAVNMNYYTAECPESTRPSDLDAYLYGSPAA